MRVQRADVLRKVGADVDEGGKRELGRCWTGLVAAVVGSCAVGQAGGHFELLP